MMWTIVVTAVIILVIWKWLSRDRDDLDSLPGPPSWPLIGSVFTFIGISRTSLFSTLRSYAKVYGDRYFMKLMQRRILHINSPEDIEIMLSHSRNIKKNYTYRFLEPWLGTGLLLSTGAKWHRRRKVLTPAFHFNVLKSFAEIIEEKSRNLALLLMEKQGEDVNVMEVISDFTLYTICETAMGTQLDYDKSTDAIEYKNAISIIGNIFIRRAFTVYYYPDIIFNNSKLGKENRKYIEKVHKFTNKVIAERRRTMESRKSDDYSQDIGIKRRLAFLDLLLEAEERGEIDDDGIREEVDTFMFEGHDTTATALTFCLMLLADHDHIQDKLFEECQRVLGNSVLTSELSDLKYLEAVIKESLRIYPSVPTIGRKIVEDFYLGDLLVKKGTEVTVDLYDILHREDLFEDPEVFRPERFLEGPLKNPFAYVPFSAGPRNCIGQRFAMLEMKYALAEVCRKFRLVPKVKGIRPKLIADMTLRIEEPIYIRFLPR